MDGKPETSPFPRPEQEKFLTRKFKRTFEFIVGAPEAPSKLSLPDGTPPQPKLKLKKFPVTCVRDVLRLDQAIRAGLFMPVPELALQIFNMFMEVSGQMEGAPEEKGPHRKKK